MISEKYMTIVKFFDHGKIKACVIPCDNNARPYYKSRKQYDEYGDVFNTKDEALEWKKAAYNA